MFWKRKKFVAATSFTGSAFDAALDYCEAHESIISVSTNEFSLQLGNFTVNVRRALDDHWLEAQASFDIRSEYDSPAYFYNQLTQKQFKHMTLIVDAHEGMGLVRFNQLMQYQARPEKHVYNMLSAFEYFLCGSESRPWSDDDLQFYCDGRKFNNATEALLFYLRKVRRCPVTNQTDGHVTFDLGGANVVVSLVAVPHEFVLRCGFNDFENLARGDRNALTPHYFAAAYRKLPLHTASYCFNDGISELAISGTLTAGTEARPIFTATLAALYQVMLDSTERIKMNPGLLTGKQQLQSEQESILQAKQFQGDRTGGVEFLRDA
ncbi:hypothetical protein DEIGR_100240 [Deinococcus grandis]|uniref:Uncharacterized protein n=2 Tax=Deinococcus grandis TaxID=57498 RepID=A0A100HGR1_9DEIO|nr:hypothetical protein [Deinococcus grandis]BBN96307.1 hypothetical protein DEGR_30400 [Deinococcus grandis]GAQ20212.1 hypothetical protein DEIGR_100240 [Deinococcus grandis]